MMLPAYVASGNGKIVSPLLKNYYETFGPIRDRVLDAHRMGKKHYKENNLDTELFPFIVTMNSLFRMATNSQKRLFKKGEKNKTKEIEQAH
jgi:hypothetical protein